MIPAARSILALTILGPLAGCEHPPTAQVQGRLEPRSVEATLESTVWSPWSQPVVVDAVNSPAQEQGPALSKDGLSLYFQASDRDGGFGANDIWVSRRVCLDCPWQPPVALGPAINTAQFNEARPSLSRDGHWLFFNSNRVAGSHGGGDIWASYRERVDDDFAWGPPVNVGPGVNTSTGESQASFFENEGGAPQLFFTRGAQMYVSTMLPDGAWGTAVAVDALNHPAGAAAPSVHPNGREIYFFSNRSGANRIWYSTRETVDSPWSAPVMLGQFTPGEASVFHPFIHAHGRTETLLMVGFTAARNGEIYLTTRTREGRGR